MTTFESSSDISIRAEKLVLDELAMWATRQRTIARDLSPTIQAVDGEVHRFAAELYDALAKAAPGIFNDRARLIRLAENSAKEEL